MTRFLVAAALAAVVGAGTAGKADAQIVYGYNVPNAGGISSGGTVLVPGGYQTYNNYYSPFTGTVQRQTYYADVFGNTAGRASAYNPWLGGYRTGYYQPNPYVNPFGGYNYGFYRRW